MRTQRDLNACAAGQAQVVKYSNRQVEHHIVSLHEAVPVPSSGQIPKWSNTLTGQIRPTPPSCRSTPRPYPPPPPPIPGQIPQVVRYPTDKVVKYPNWSYPNGLTPKRVKFPN